MQFIAFAPAGGQADYYEIDQTDALKITSKRVNFYSGYNSMNFMADKVGRHILLFVLNNQPSNCHHCRCDQPGTTGSAVPDAIGSAVSGGGPDAAIFQYAACLQSAEYRRERLQSDHYERPRPDHYQRIDLLPDVRHILSTTDSSRDWRHSSYHSVSGNEGLSGLSG